LHTFEQQRAGGNGAGRAATSAIVSNVSLQHEAPLTVLRRSPGFVRELVALLGHVPVATGESVIVDANLTSGRHMRRSSRRRPTPLFELY